MNCIILSIGDELILGQTVDTNSAWLAQQLAAIGVACLAHVTVSDDQSAITRVIKESAARCDVLLISGGLGPTPDDLTRQALAEALGVPLELNASALETLEGFFTKIKRAMPPSNKIQAMLPRGSNAIANPNGTAPGIHAEFPHPRCHIYVMPGVPGEMKPMFRDDVLPALRTGSSGAVILSKTLHTFGMGESAVAELLGPLMDRKRNPSVGTTVANGYVSLRLNSRFPTSEEAQRELESTEAGCRTALNALIFGAEDESLPLATSRLMGNRSVTTAESCTGGLLSKLLTDVPGSSSFFKQGWITYSNEAKHDRLGVSENIINVNGAVSEPVVTAMATNARRLAKADFALAISGIAGPGGGSELKPVGTVCIALAHMASDTSRAERYSRSTVSARTFLFPGDRQMVRDRAAKMALTLLRYHLLNQPLPF
ncbi:MAG TPA: competence/damage-inducible protein A [Tepidisphaeraceae bacterium]|jgi:nicotinamide-nucleotide amidase|nr:competence/damage-inducible protein A [Tepidisphaeraceae bacterium]